MKTMAEAVYLQFNSGLEQKYKLVMAYIQELDSVLSLLNEKSGFMRSNFCLCVCVCVFPLSTIESVDFYKIR
jgi:hypothetical protein